MSDDEILDADVVHVVRAAASGLGFNATFVDDDMKVIVGLAQRAVLAGLIGDAKPDMQERFTAAAEQHRGAHEKALGYGIVGVAAARRAGAEAMRERAAKVADTAFAIADFEAKIDDMDAAANNAGVVIATAIRALEIEG